MLNKVILIGRLTKDPDIRNTTSGVVVGSFTLAVNRSYVSQNGVREADFINCVCFRKLAEIVGRYVRKGQLISVEGRIQTRNYDAQDGTKRYVTEVICDNVVFLESSRSQNENSNYYQQSQPTFNINNEQPRFNNNYQENKTTQSDQFFDDSSSVDISEDDLPF
jgi:single-strand DNA-binding protein